MNSIVVGPQSHADSLHALTAVLRRAFAPFIELGKLLSQPGPQAPLYPWPARHPAEIAIRARQAHAKRHRAGAES